jgi:hypothetical protein
MQMTETSTVTTDLPNHLYGTRAGLFYLLNKLPRPESEPAPTIPVYRLEESHRVASPARRSSRKTVQNTSDEPDICSILLQDCFVFVSVEDRQQV